MDARTKPKKQVLSLLGRSFRLHQLFLAGLSLIIGVVFWFFQVPDSLVPVVLFTFVIGNFTYFPIRLAAGLFGGLPTVRRWLLFLALLVPAGIAGGVVAAFGVYWLTAEHLHARLWPYVYSNVLVGLFVTLLTGIVMFAVVTMRTRLEAVNRRLQDQVQLGAIELQGQAAELTTAHEIQAHLIPANLPQVPGLQVSGAWQPARAVGGDYFDVLALDRGRLGVCIADVSGKGMGAALLMANLQAAFRAFATEDIAPDALCGKLNRALCASIAPGKFVTFFYGVIEVAGLIMRYENAGHNLPMLLRGPGAMPVEGGGTVLGLFPEAQYAGRTLQLLPGDCLLLATDGITEAAHPDRLDDEFGEARMVQAAQAVRAEGAHAMRSRILEEVTSFCDGHFGDDASLIVVLVEG